MGASAGHAVLQQVGRLFGQGTLAGRNDAELLARFLQERDELAFEALIARHGPMVLSVCRHLIGRPADVDDAFQATFLILVRRARSIRQPERLGPWLYGVAHRVAARLRVQAARRAAREVAAIEEPALPDAASLDADVSALIHQEVHRLPQKYRDPIVLCYLEGQTHESAAAILAWPVGTVRGRLARARELLRARLTRRGVTLPAAAISAWLMSATADAAVPPGLLESTTRAAVLSVAGTGATAGAVSATVLNLREGVLNTMWLSKLKTGAVLLVMILVSTSAAVWAYQEGGSGPGVPPARAQAKARASVSYLDQLNSAVPNADEPPAARAQDDKEELKLLDQLTAARFDVEVLETQVEVERDLLRQGIERQTRAKFEASQQFFGASEEQVKELRKQEEESRRKDNERLDALKKHYQEDTGRLILAKRAVERFELKLGDAHPNMMGRLPRYAESPSSTPPRPDLEARLTTIEQKLDRVLKALDKAK